MAGKPREEGNPRFRRSHGSSIDADGDNPDNLSRQHEVF